MMDKTGIKLFNLMFRPGETVCVSHNKYGYHSIPLQNAIAGPVILVPPQHSAEKMKKTQEEATERAVPEQLTLVSLNPIQGFREDLNCTAFRSFLVEMDYGPLPEQLAYAKRIGLPYSAVVFSGNKSLHFLITLDTDLPSESVYRKFSEWILNIATIADQNTRNPSRSIRIPGAYREPKKKQILLEGEFRGRTPIKELVEWLNKHPEAKPVEREKRQMVGKHDLNLVSNWVRERLINGLDPAKGRNKQWFSIACEFALAGYSEDDTFDILADFFIPDRDFKDREWKTAVKSGFKYVYDRNKA